MRSEMILCNRLLLIFSFQYLHVVVVVVVVAHLAAKILRSEKKKRLKYSNQSSPPCLFALCSFWLVLNIIFIVLFMDLLVHSGWWLFKLRYENGLQ